MGTTIRCGLFGGIGYSVFAYAGFVYAPAAHGSVLLPGMLPFWTALLSVVLLRERLTGMRMTALAMIMTGGALVGVGYPLDDMLQMGVFAGLRNRLPADA